MKSKFKLEDYTGKYVMHCNKKEKAEVFCNFLYEHGIYEHGRTWYDGSSYKEDTHWHTYGRRTCYSFNEGLYGDKEYYLAERYTVLEFDDFDWGEDIAVESTNVNICFCRDKDPTFDELSCGTYFIVGNDLLCVRINKDKCGSAFCLTDNTICTFADDLRVKVVAKVKIDVTM